MGVRIDDLEGNLQALLRQETSNAYGQSVDYLGLGDEGHLYLVHGGSSNKMSRVDSPSSPSPASPCSALASPLSPERWKMTTQSRWQVGQWFYRSKYEKLCDSSC